MPSPPFLLNKWYLDVLDPSGRGMIAYQADLSWGKVTLHYDGIVPMGKPGIKSAGSFSSKGVVSQTDQVLKWENGDATGTWHSCSPSVNYELLNSADGFVRWHCLQPSSAVKVKIGDTVLEGTGYAERMEMTLAPWKLPIRELLWGRYVSSRHAVVWIRWSGPQPRHLLFFNGKLDADPSLTSSVIAFGPHTITLPNSLVRKGTVGESLFAGAGKLAALFPKSILGLEEEKWCGPAALKLNDETIDEGNVVHEIVRWP